jgi:hypothetical protein
MAGFKLIHENTAWERLEVIASGLTKTEALAWAEEDSKDTAYVEVRNPKGEIIKAYGTRSPNCRQFMPRPSIPRRP